MLSRWWIYLQEMYQPSSRLLFSALMTYITWAVWIAPHSKSFPWIPFLAASLSYALMILYYRISDEFKDADTDRQFFPHRPVPSGRVSLQDLQYLRHTVSTMAFLLQAFIPHSFITFLIFWLFSWGMSRWFFMPKLIGGNRLMAFLTHCPVGFIGGFYLLHAMSPAEVRLVTPASFVFVYVLNGPGLVWELLRKTRSPLAEQMGYQTYSQILGLGGALTLAAVFAAIVMVLAVWAAPTWQLPEWTMQAMMATHILLLMSLPWIYVRLKKEEMELRMIGDVYNASILIILGAATFSAIWL